MKPAKLHGNRIHIPISFNLYGFVVEEFRQLEAFGILLNGATKPNEISVFPVGGFVVTLERELYNEVYS